MSDIMVLTDAELDAVAGGNYGRSSTISYSTIDQSNSSSISQSASATAYNYGNVSATVSYSPYGVAAAAGAEASAANSARVSQSNSVRA
jgi:uncharacterized alpha-E superfamily protein